MRVERAFAFVDLSGFTRFTDAHGDEEAVGVLTRFRAAVREAVLDHAVRVDKWLGDGVMLVSTDDDRLVEAVLKLVRGSRASAIDLPLRVGMAAGPVILLEGDDYVGSAVNLAARLCTASAPNELLVTPRLATALPEGATAVPVGALEVPGFAHPVQVTRIEADTLATPL